MAVVGQQALIISNIGRKSEVSPFAPDYKALQKVPIVDVAISYTCPYNHNICILIVKDLLIVPSLKKTNTTIRHELFRGARECHPKDTYHLRTIKGGPLNILYWT